MATKAEAMCESLIPSIAEHWLGRYAEVSSEVCAITDGPGEFDIAMALFRGHGVHFTNAEKSQYNHCRVHGFIPARGDDCRTSLVWMTTQSITRQQGGGLYTNSAVIHFIGTYSLSRREGWFHRVQIPPK